MNDLFHEVWHLKLSECVKDILTSGCSILKCFVFAVLVEYRVKDILQNSNVLIADIFGTDELHKDLLAIDSWHLWVAKVIISRFIIKVLVIQKLWIQSLFVTFAFFRDGFTVDLNSVKLLA